MGLLSRLFSTAKPPPAGKADRMAYAVGDIHGRLDLLDALLARIEADRQARPRKRTYIVFLGDLIDRGPDSRGVIERLRHYAPSGAQPVFLLGNHEEALLTILDGDSTYVADWLGFGGAECAQSYGLDPAMLAAIEPDMAAARLREAVPTAHRRFLKGFADSFRFGDYLFVHAGIRPGVPLEEQAARDLRWIRAPFLDDLKDHGMMVVHGHTIVPAVDERPNRIAIDTGAYRTGRLTAIGIEGRDRWFLSAEAAMG